MIIKELRLCNFLVFPGEQELAFPTEGESNLVVILAPNNTGKTSVIRALKFLFYGHLPDCTEATAYRLINDRERARTAVMAEASGWVEITIVRDEEDIHVRRSIRARKAGKDQWQPPEISLFRVERAAKTWLIQIGRAHV